MINIWIEAESFRHLGGWVIETQSVPHMGSAYIMAHGMGIPVEDAETTFAVPQRGTYHIWVRTRDWTACWNRGSSAGKFQLSVNHRTLPVVLGTNGETWDWQYAGGVQLEAGTAALTLHDMTGFNGRCDAILITDSAEKPSSDAEDIRQMRAVYGKAEPVWSEETYDLIIAGGGMAGTCMALAAIRSGVKVLLIQDRSILGGCNSSEIRVSLGGVPHSDPYPNIGNTVAEIGPIFGSGGTYPKEFYEDDRKTRVFSLQNPNMYKLRLNAAVVDLQKDPDDPQKIAAVLVMDMKTGEQTWYRAPLFADCTGDGVLARFMGAETMYGTESRAVFNESLAPLEGSNEVMGQSILWLSEETDEVQEFPEIDWGMEIHDGNVLYVKGGDWEWESGQYRNQAMEAEYIRDYAMMAIYANWAYLKHHSARKDEWAKRRLTWVSPIGGKRESYRVVGDVVLTQQDVEDHVPYPDASAAITWNIDIHYPDPKHTPNYPEPFYSCAYHRGIGAPYAVPYRCLYARDVKNLFLGGRIISTSHVAFAAVRVMRTLGQLGEVVGMAAAICKNHSALPRDVYTDYLPELIERMEKGIPVPYYHGWLPSDRHQTYHFKELGHIRIPGEYKRILEDPELKERIVKLDVTHVDGFKMKDVVLPDEE